MLTVNDDVSESAPRVLSLVCVGCDWQKGRAMAYFVKRSQTASNQLPLLRIEQQALVIVVGNFADDCSLLTNR